MRDVSPEAADQRNRLHEGLRAAFIAGAKEDSRGRLGRGLSREELERVLLRHPAISKMPRGRLGAIATVWLVSALAVVGCGREADPTVPGSASSPRLGEAGISTVPMPPDPAFVTAVQASCLIEMVTDPSIPLVVHDQRRADLASLLPITGLSAMRGRMEC